MKYYLIGMTFSFIWIAYEMYRAPQMDERGKILKPGKKVSDLFKKKEIKLVTFVNSLIFVSCSFLFSKVLFLNLFQCFVSFLQRQSQIA